MSSKPPIDSDNPEWTRADFERAVKTGGAPLGEAVKMFRRARGPQKAPTKVQVTLRLDRDIVETFRATGRGWQSRLNQTLRKAMG
ncbi:BrnA antitoxin family protein [Pedomonas sp. V897]|uniref:BrnA antitoxin family protein n=1 Tax=Pedomonas sp. V897 TaxID=3446482 RepID=UPI003EDFC622